MLIWYQQYNTLW